MRRRDLITLAGCAAAGSIVPSLPVGAQQSTMPVIGFLGQTAPAPDQVASFLEGLGEGGFREGSVSIQYRWAHSDSERLPALMVELLRYRPAVIVTIGGTPSALAAKSATTTVPVAFEVGRDPVATGLVASLNRPGGNLTGVYMLTTALNAKRLELLHEMVPGALTIATLINPRSPAAQDIENEVRAAAAAAGVQLLVVRERDIDAALAVIVEKRSGALIVSNDAFFNSRREQLVALTARYSLPTIFEWREFAALGGLMSYGTDLSSVLRQLGSYVALILKGAKPANMPVVQPTRFELVINRKTAKALGLTIPQSLLLRADAVID